MRESRRFSDTTSKLNPSLTRDLADCANLFWRVFLPTRKTRAFEALISVISPHLSRAALLSAGVLCAGLLLSGCSKSSGPSLAIISPHNKEIQTEFTALWKKDHPNVPINWIDQGGTSDDLKFVRDQFATRGKDKGIGVDLFFGGGGETFTELEDDGLLSPLPEDYGVPAELNGVPLHGKNNVWVAAALSGFGILYNKPIAARDNLPIPATWADLANPKLQERVELADPRHSGSAHTAYEIILQTNGWDKGWKLLTGMTGNVRKFATASSEPLTDVKNGEAVFCSSIDFYASSAIAQAGKEKLGYIEPKGQNIVTADPIALLPGAPHAEEAQAFIKMVMSPAGQKIWFLPKGSEGGPTASTLYRLPALPTVYEPIPKDSWTQSNPYKTVTTAPYDSAKAAVRRRALDDLIGTILVDNVGLVKAAWKRNPNLEKVGYVPISEADFAVIAPKWDDAKFAASTKAKWNAAARQHFGG